MPLSYSFWWIGTRRCGEAVLEAEAPITGEGFETHAQLQVFTRILQDAGWIGAPSWCLRLNPAPSPA